MSDINWRNIEGDFSIFAPENKYKSILIFTELGVIRESLGRYVEPWGYKCNACGEKVIKYAFI